MKQKEVDKIFSLLLKDKRNNPNEMVPPTLVLASGNKRTGCNMNTFFVTPEMKRMAMKAAGFAARRLEEEDGDKIDEIALITEVWFRIIPKDASGEEKNKLPSASPDRINGIMVCTSKDKGKYKVYAKKIVEKNGKVDFEENEDFGVNAVSSKSELFDAFWNAYFGLCEI